MLLSAALLFVAQQHDGRISIVADVWDHVIDSFDKQFEAPSWRKFCQHFITALEGSLTAQVEAKMEVISIQKSFQVDHQRSSTEEIPIFWLTCV